MTKRAGVKFRASCGRLRRFAVYILLFAIGALVLQVPVHAGPGGHAIHQQQAAGTASHCTQHHVSDDHGANQSAGCVNTDPMLTTVVDPDAPPVPRLTVLVTPVVVAPVPMP